MLERTRCCAPHGVRSRLCNEFEFQTHLWHADAMATTPLAGLAGRPCPIAAAMEVVGERWSLLVVREIALGANRFSAIVAGTGAPRDRIAARLKTLEAAGVIARTAYQDHPPRDEYGLTASGAGPASRSGRPAGLGADHAVAADDPPPHPATDHSSETKETP